MVPESVIGLARRAVSPWWRPSTRVLARKASAAARERVTSPPEAGLPVDRSKLREIPALLCIENSRQFRRFLRRYAQSGKDVRTPVDHAKTTQLNGLGPFRARDGDPHSAARNLAFAFAVAGRCGSGRASDESAWSVSGSILTTGDGRRERALAGWTVVVTGQGADHHLGCGGVR